MQQIEAPEIPVSNYQKSSLQVLKLWTRLFNYPKLRRLENSINRRHLPNESSNAGLRHHVVQGQPLARPYH